MVSGCRGTSYPVPFRSSLGRRISLLKAEPLMLLHALLHDIQVRKDDRKEYLLPRIVRGIDRLLTGDALTGVGLNHHDILGPSQ